MEKYINNQYAQENMLNIINHKGDTNLYYIKPQGYTASYLLEWVRDKILAFIFKNVKC